MEFRAKAKLLWSEVKRRLWIIPIIYSVSAIAVVVFASRVDVMFPDLPTFDLPVEAIKGLLSIIASSMLAVTIFAVSVLNSAFSTAVGNTSPRAFEVLVADGSTKQALSSFVGAFIFAVIGLIGLNTEVFGEGGRTVMFLMTLAVFVWVVGTFVYWIDYVTHLSHMRTTIRRLSESAEDILATHLARPGRGATPTPQEPDPSLRGAPVTSGEAGVIKTLSVSALKDVAEEHDLVIRVLLRAGHMVGRETVIAEIETGTLTDEARDAVRSAFVVGYDRDSDQDPEMSIRLLSEVGERALSPGINDPGTAMDVLNALTRTFGMAFEKAEDAEPPSISDRVFLPIIAPEVFMTAAFAQIARDGAGTVEVAERLQAALEAVAQSSPPEYAVIARNLSASSLKRAEDALEYEWEKQQVRRAANWARGDERTIPLS